MSFTLRPYRSTPRVANISRARTLAPSCQILNLNAQEGRAHLQEFLRLQRRLKRTRGARWELRGTLTLYGNAVY